MKAHLRDDNKATNLTIKDLTGLTQRNSFKRTVGLIAL